MKLCSLCARAFPFFSLMLGLALVAHAARADDPWLTIKGGAGPGQGKHIVLVSGDEEYRSEELLPQLAKILAKEHGFDCTVLFAIDPATGEINPNELKNIPGLEALKSADLLILLTRFRDLPDEQMQHFVDYLNSGKPIIGLRTATHAFKMKSDEKFGKFSYDSKNAKKKKKKKKRSSAMTAKRLASNRALANRFWAKPGSATTAVIKRKARAP